MMKCIIFATFITCAWAASLDDVLSYYKNNIDKMTKSIEKHVEHMDKTTAANILSEQAVAFFSNTVYFSKKLPLEAHRISSQFKIFADNAVNIIPDFVNEIHYKKDLANLSAHQLLKYFVEASQYLVTIAYKIVDFSKASTGDKSNVLEDLVKEALTIALEANKNLDKELEKISGASSSSGNS